MGHFKYQKCEFSKWAKFDSLPIEQACFVLMDFEPPPLEYLRWVYNDFSDSRRPTWDEPAEYENLLRSLNVSIQYKSVAVNRMTEDHYHTIHIRWAELIRWAQDKGYDVPAELLEIVKKSSTTKSDGIAALWPWGSHHTELLGHLDAAARKFWVNYDPANPKVTAPKAETIISWLVTERGVSETMATAMATMLRPDGLKTGPRK